MSDDEYTPTTDELRRNFAFSQAGDRIHRTDQYFEAFDRWFASVIAEAEQRGRAEGWDEGKRASVDIGWNGTRYTLEARQDATNPYVLTTETEK